MDPEAEASVAEAAERDTSTQEGAEGADGPQDGQEGSEAAAEGAQAGEGQGDADGQQEGEGDAPKRQPWFQARISDLTRQKAELQRKHDAAMALLNAKDGEKAAGESGDAPKTFTEDEIDRRASAKASELAQQQALTKACNDLFAKGVETHKDGFVQARDSLVEALGDTLNARPDFLEALTELPNGHEVFFALAKDLDHAAEVLSLPPARMGVALAKLGAEAGRVKPKPISGAPEPIVPLRGSARAELDIDDPDLPIDEFMRRRNKQDTLRFN